MLSSYLLFITLLFSSIKGDDTIPIPTLKNTGTRWAITRNGINEIINLFILPNLEAEINGSSIPDMSGTAKTSIGKVDYSMSNIMLSNFVFNEAGFDLNSYDNLIELNANLNGSIKIDYTYNMLSFPYTSDRGIATIFIDGTKLFVSISSGRNDALRLVLGLNDADVNITNFDISIESDKAWLYEMLLSIFQDQIVNGINNLFTEVLRQVIEDLFFKIGYGPTYLNSGVGAIIDICNTNEEGLTVFDNWITIQMSWYVVPFVENYEEKGRELFTSITEVPEFMSEYNGKTFQIIVGKKRVYELMQIQYSTGVFSETVSKDGVHDEYFFPSFWDGILEVSSNYNDVTSWSYKFDFSDELSLEFLVGAIRVKTHLFVTFIDQNGTERINLKLPVVISASPRINEKTLSLTQDLVEIVDIQILNGDAKVICTQFDSVEEMINELLFTHVNEILGRGGFPCKDSSNTGNIYHEGDETYEIVPDTVDSDGVLVYSMEPIIVM